MNVQDCHSRIISLLSEFLCGQIDTTALCRDVTSLWERSRHEYDRIRSSWSAPYDQHLIEDRLAGRVSQDEWEERWLELWNISPADKKVLDALDSLFSACDAVDDPEPATRVSDEQLKETAREQLDHLLKA